MYSYTSQHFDITSICVELATSSLVPTEGRIRVVMHYKQLTYIHFNFFCFEVGIKYGV